MLQFEGDRKPLIRDRTSMDGHQLPKSPKTISRILQILPFHWVSGVFCRKPCFYHYKHTLGHSHGLSQRWGSNVYRKMTGTSGGKYPVYSLSAQYQNSPIIANTRREPARHFKKDWQFLPSSGKTANVYTYIYTHIYIYILLYIYIYIIYIYTYISFGTSRLWNSKKPLRLPTTADFSGRRRSHPPISPGRWRCPGAYLRQGGNTFPGGDSLFGFGFLYSKQPTKQKEFWVKQTPRIVKLNGSLHSSRCHWFWTNPKWYSLDGVGFDLIHPNNLHRRMYPVQSRFFWGKANNLVRPYIIIYLHCSWCYIATLWAIGSWLGWSNPAE